MVIDVRPATTLKEASDQMEETIGLCKDDCVKVGDTVLSRLSTICKSVNIDALLELADEMDERSRWVCIGDAVHAKACARRIREAIGDEP